MHGTLGHYRIVEPIGSGGMGIVYRARDEHLERDVAIKVLSGATLPDDDARRRFRREALALSKLNHPNIATIHDFNTFDGVDVLVMEHIPGSDLDELLRGGPLDEPTILRLGGQLMTALDAAHRHGVVHRDLKPGNVRVTDDGRLKVLDFGLAQPTQFDNDDLSTQTATSTMFSGTLPYMAPEQIRGGVVDHRTDIYAAGAVLYEMATGSRLHPGLSGARLMGAVLEDPPIPARALNPRISAALEQILIKALDKDPQLRYQSARELQVDLERLEAGPTSPAARRSVLTRWPAAAAAIVLALIVGTGWYLWPAAAPFSGRILIADLENHTKDPDLSNVIRHGLAVKLQQSRALNLLSREQVVDALRRMERDVDRPLDVQTAIEVGQREGIPLILAGAVHQQGDAIAVSVTGMDPVTRATRFTNTATFTTHDGVFKGLDDLARDVRRNLGESVAGIAQSNQPLADVTTPSFDALRLYTSANDRLLRGDADQALPLLLQAIQVDPTFAMAHRLIARLYERRGNAPKAREHLALAFDHRDKLTQKERLHVEASFYKGRGEYEKAVNTLTAAADLFPSDVQSRYELALAYRDAGQSGKAVEQLEALASDPYYTSLAYGLLALQFARDSDFARVRAIYEKARARKLTLPQLEWAHGIMLLAEGKVPQARAQFEALEASSAVHAGIARLYLANADILEGRLAAARERLRIDIAADQRKGDLNAENKRRYILGQLWQLEGNRAAAAEQLAAMLSPGVQRLGANESLLTGVLAVSIGDLPRAGEMLRHLDRQRVEAPSAFVESCYYLLAAEIALAQKRPAEAIEQFKRSALNYPRVLSSQGLARAFAAQGDWRQAREMWTTVVNARGSLLHDGFGADWALAHLELARASREAGAVPDAREYYDRFLDRWEGGDDLPLLKVAAREREALGQ